MPTKWFLDSLTVRGTLLAVIPTVIAVLKLFHVEIGDGEVNAIVEGLAGLAGCAGAVMAIIGRFRAKPDLTLT